MGFIDRVVIAALLTTAACAELPATEPIAATGDCAVTITTPRASELVGDSIQISVAQSCAGWTQSMIAYIDGVACDDPAYPYPEAGCKLTDGEQNFPSTLWIKVTPGAHVLNVNNWSADGKVGDSTHVAFSDDAGSAAGSDAGPGTGSGWKFAPTLSVDELDQNNTSACGAKSGPCTEAWTQTHTITYGKNSADPGATKSVAGYWDNLVSGGPHDPGSAVGRVSKVPVSALLEGHSVPVYVASQNWWSRSGHIVNGEDSTNVDQAANQVDDLISRGFSGETVAWEGPGTFPDTVVKHLLAAAEGKNFKIGVRVESQYFGACGKTVACVNAAAKYVKETLATSSAYLRDPSDHPILYFFLGDSDEYTLPGKSTVDADGTTFVMLAPRGLPQTRAIIGEFDWVPPSASGDGFSNLTSFYADVKKSSGAYAIASVFKGFDDQLATWWLKRVIDQKCGMTWLQTFDHTGSFAGSASYMGAVNFLAAGGKLGGVMVDTWDDYEEGTEIETGIDNCLTKFTAALDADTHLLSWTATWGTDPMNSAFSGSAATVHHYAVYVIAKGGDQAMHLTDVACTPKSCPQSLDVSKLGITGGPYAFYVQAVGQPSIVNHLAGPTTTTYSH